MNATQWQAQSRSVSDGALVVKDQDFNEICVIREKAERSYGEQDKADQANAVLIAAAPELLRACELVLSAIEWSTTDERKSAEEQAHALRAAIAKATGG